MNGVGTRDTVMTGEFADRLPAQFIVMVGSVLTGSPGAAIQPAASGAKLRSLSPFDHAGFQRAVIHVVAVGTSERVKPVMSAAAPETGSSSSRPSATHACRRLRSSSGFGVLRVRSGSLL